MDTTSDLPATIGDQAELDRLLSSPPPYVIDTLSRLDGDLIVLGVGGKMGPTLARMARRAFDEAGLNHRVVGVSRFSNPEAKQELEDHGIETIAGDLLDPSFVTDLPDAAGVVYMAGMKFGSTENVSLTWAMNTYLPTVVCQRYAHARIAAFSTGNVYGLRPVVAGGSLETDEPRPEGEYAMSCLGRERMFEHFSQTQNTPVSLLRLNYAVEMRYGVIEDLAQRLVNHQPIDLAMGVVNLIWQGDANAMALASLAHSDSPATILNLTGPEALSVRRLAEQLASRMNLEPTFTSEEAPDALLNNAQRAIHLFGYPRVGVDQLLDWTADWVSRGGARIDKPTHFQTRDGKF